MSVELLFDAPQSVVRRFAIFPSSIDNSKRVRIHASEREGGCSLPRPFLKHLQGKGWRFLGIAAGQLDLRQRLPLALLDSELEKSVLLAGDVAVLLFGCVVDLIFCCVSLRRHHFSFFVDPLEHHLLGLLLLLIVLRKVLQELGCHLDETHDCKDRATSAQTSFQPCSTAPEPVRASQPGTFGSSLVFILESSCIICFTCRSGVIMAASASSDAPESTPNIARARLSRAWRM
mmetsp:Transcript_12917/g.45368  ORF Transcript_12917/g.45368 Transcript_12917/m.45368 type:complete len:232 (-) Transcript_12917:1285-1980(-)